MAGIDTSRVLAAGQAFVAEIEQVQDARLRGEITEMRRREIADLVEAVKNVLDSTGGLAEVLGDALGEFPAGWDEPLQEAAAGIESISEELGSVVSELRPTDQARPGGVR